MAAGIYISSRPTPTQLRIECPHWVISRQFGPILANGSFWAVSGRYSGPILQALARMSALTNSGRSIPRNQAGYEVCLRPIPDVQKL